MTPQELKNSILQLAIQGKLVEQRAEEGTAEELFAQIQQEKQRLIAEKKIKKEKPLPEITEEEKPFDIPESWKWCRLGSILYKLTDGAHSTPKYIASGVPFLSVKDISSGKLNFLNCKYISEQEHKELYARCNPEFGDLLLTKVGTTGIPVIVDTNEQFSLFVSVALLKFNQNLIYNKFLQILINSPLVQIQAAENTRGVGNKNWVMRDIASTIIVLPPLAEQKRIVVKIQELMPYIDRYEKAWSKLEKFNSRFPEDMKKSLLQYAIQGKLVEQRAEEGTAEELFAKIQEEKQRLIAEKKNKKEKPLPEITEEEKPFDIPESWKWVRLGALVQFENGDRSIKYPVETDYVDFGVPFFGAKDMGEKYMSFDNVRYISEHKFNELGNGKLHDQDFICLLRGSVGKIAIFEKDSKHKTGFICAQMVIMRCIDLDMVQYLYYIMKSMHYTKSVDSKTTGTAIRQLPAKELANVLIPLPPLAEQKRIVKKLEQLLPLCERLK